MTHSQAIDVSQTAYGCASDDVRQAIRSQAVQRAHALRQDAIANAAKGVALFVLQALDRLINQAELAVHRRMDRLQRAA